MKKRKSLESGVDSLKEEACSFVQVRRIEIIVCFIIEI